ncbi:site-2 protease family protein [Aliikangiella sp. G2MR2-5]|uniref:site-2 protease family protein n=1 Tax=Aliikangiella sp. G2MR2-5 TaxID=2788943 RepID=UPI0021131B4B|nr:site-2 protease family protein [Aliikangiella sp. G2MR2-5]
MIHVIAMSIGASMFGVTIKTISFGLGRKLMRLGKVQLSMVPLGSFVKLADSSDQPLEQVEVGFGQQSLGARLIIPLLGPITTITLAYFILGSPAGNAFVSTFYQAFNGAVSPLSEAQLYLKQAQLAVDQEPLLIVCGLVLVKVSALNLIPFPGTTGFQLILTVITSDQTESHWQERLANWLLWPLLLFLGSWLVALVFYFIQ